MIELEECIFVTNRRGRSSESTGSRNELDEDIATPPSSV
jgi:hypothetical protein